ncbi:NAD(P)-dependent dehydrogenase, short-chain alcohol dehydrogenase family [Novosphingobium sp. CF614]|uniref:SDR family NAD(P)-dependent oxidoreductase n=1 Tax=Novosphingobium sp. CF614 TaxID=1884364 RepID=UPI0008EF3D59|nr:SDR family oxidoreductase [Novosphingobium sp. CF614]SFG00507.1 NAD(P)-dependent dehydrogenase, short-chain alcohol dehydrogenase family [Novosphingobium sp. CF614]
MAGILVIGGASGLGGEIAEAFARQGDGVVLADAEAPRFAVEHFVALDLAATDAGGLAAGEAAARLGRLDALVVAASAMESAPIAEWTPAMWDRAAAINLRLPFLAVQASLPWLRVSDNASVTVVSSTATMRGQPFTHAYQATKAGVAGLVRSLAAELGPDGIRVNAVLAGWLDTPLTRAYWAGREHAAAEREQVDGRIPLRRHGRAEEAAALVRFLASPAASYLTGAMLPVDGGDTAV